MSATPSPAACLMRASSDWSALNGISATCFPPSRVNSWTNAWCMRLNSGVSGVQRDGVLVSFLLGELRYLTRFGLGVQAQHVESRCAAMRRSGTLRAIVGTITSALSATADTPLRVSGPTIEARAVLERAPVVLDDQRRSSSLTG